MPSWFEKLKIDNRTGRQSAWPWAVIGLFALGVAVRPLPALSQLRHVSGPLVEIRRPPKRGFDRLVMQTPAGLEVFFPDVPVTSALQAASVRHRPMLEVWLYKDIGNQRAWQLVADGNSLIVYDDSLRRARKGRGLLLALGVVFLGASVAVIEYRSRNYYSEAHEVTLRHVTQVGDDPLEPYYEASCKCGWSEGLEDDLESVRKIARRHAGHVREDVEEVTVKLESE